MQLWLFRRVSRRIYGWRWWRKKNERRAETNSFPASRLRLQVLVRPGGKECESSAGSGVKGALQGGESARPMSWLHGDGRDQLIYLGVSNGEVKSQLKAAFNGVSALQSGVGQMDTHSGVAKHQRMI